jgi:hypothetical protein
LILLQIRLRMFGCGPVGRSGARINGYARPDPEAITAHWGWRTTGVSTRAPAPSPGLPRKTATAPAQIISSYNPSAASWVSDRLLPRYGKRLDPIITFGAITRTTNDGTTSTFTIDVS